MSVDPARNRLMPGAIEALRALQRESYRLIVVAHHSGIAWDMFPESALGAIEGRLQARLAAGDVIQDGLVNRPRRPERRVAVYVVDGGHRRPAHGPLLRAARDRHVGLHASWFVSDIHNDVEAGRRSGCRRSCSITVTRTGGCPHRSASLITPVPT